MRRRLFPAMMLAASILGASVPAGAEPVTIRVAGSTTLQPLLEEAAKLYSAAHPDVSIVVVGGGSKAGLALLREAATDVAMTDSAPPENEGFVDHDVALLGLALVVHPGTGITRISAKQVRDAFSGAIKNWRAIGGNDVPVVPVDRSPSLVAHAIFAGLFMGGAPVSADAQLADASDAAARLVAQTPGAISYVVSKNVSFEGVTPLALDGAPPSEEAILAGSYRFWTYEHLVTLKQPTTAQSRFFAFVATQRALLKKFGFIAVKQAR